MGWSELREPDFRTRPKDLDGLQEHPVVAGRQNSPVG